MSYHQFTAEAAQQARATSESRNQAFAGLSGIIGGAAQPRALQLHDQIELLMHQLSGLSEAVDSLTERLKPVCSQKGAGGVATGQVPMPAQEQLCSIATTIREARLRVEDQKTALRHMLATLEI